MQKEDMPVAIDALVEQLDGVIKYNALLDAAINDARSAGVARAPDELKAAVLKEARGLHDQVMGRLRDELRADQYVGLGVDAIIDCLTTLRPGVGVPWALITDRIPGARNRPRPVDIEEALR